MTEDLLTTLVALPKETILGFTIYTRSSPPCVFCKQAKMSLKNHFGGIPVTEIDISIKGENQEAWAKLVRQMDSIRSIPQVFIQYEVDSEPKTVHIGGADSLSKLCAERKSNASTVQ